MRIAIDFDGTIVEEKFPDIGKLKPNARDVIRKLKMKGHSIIINTCRAGIEEGDVYEFMINESIPFDYINCNRPEDILFFGQDCRKISADLYIDDKQIGGLPDWEKIYEYILKLEYNERQNA